MVNCYYRRNFFVHFIIQKYISLFYFFQKKINLYIEFKLIMSYHYFNIICKNDITEKLNDKKRDN